MIALLSRWKLKNGCPPPFAAALQALTDAVRSQEAGTLMYSVHVPAPHPPIGPPPDYEVNTDPDLAQPIPPKDLIFFEVYRDVDAYSEHLRGAVNDFMRINRDYFETPWQGHPRPETTYLDPRLLFVRGDIAEPTLTWRSS
jgi:quinol monooxygenase YgiN